MATEIDIANRALRRLGAQGITSLDPDVDASRNALVVQEFYESVRDEVLRLVPWTCAMKRATLSEVPEWEAEKEYALASLVRVGEEIYRCTTAGTSGATAPTGAGTDGSAVWEHYSTVPVGYAYAYIVPSDCLRVFTVGSSAQYLHERGVIYSNEAGAVLRYTRQSTDPTEWDALLQSAVVLRLATAIAQEITAKPEFVTQFMGEFTLIISNAKVQTLGEGREAPERVTRWEDVT